MKISVLINNYNYAQYITEAIDCVTQQTRVPDELIIVDDGSTDNSPEIIHKAIREVPYAKVIATENRGQLSAVNEGISAATGDILFFLDADDRYKKNHIECCEQVFLKKPHIGFIYTSHKNFGCDDKTHHSFDHSRQIGVCVLTTGYLHSYLGSIMSTHAIKREYLIPLFPIPERFYKAWKTRADNIIIWGAGLTGACKYYLREPTVLYRIHGNNHFAGKDKVSEVEANAYNLASDQIVNYMWNKLGYSQQLGWKTADEFKTIENPTKKEVRRYIKIHQRIISSYRKRLSLALKLYRLYFTKYR
ncbi:glycosyltransferase family A protein [Pontiellaceae bacterium B12219]|nr:glycosyltransferase family A protein [Pontiellaceae bacterium B12219]